MKQVSTQLHLQKNLNIESISKTPWFIGDVKRLLEYFTVDPFDTDDFTVVNNKTIIFHEEVVKSIKNISDLGEKQIKNFWNK